MSNQQRLKCQVCGHVFHGVRGLHTDSHVQKAQGAKRLHRDRRLTYLQHSRKLASSCLRHLAPAEIPEARRPPRFPTRAETRRANVRTFASIPLGTGRRNDDSGTRKRSSETPASGGSEQAAEPPSRGLQHRESTGKAGNRAREREAGRSQDSKHCASCSRSNRTD